MKGKASCGFDTRATASQLKRTRGDKRSSPSLQFTRLAIESHSTNSVIVMTSTEQRSSK